MNIPFVSTDPSNYRVGRRDSIRVIVIHDEESPEIKGSALNNARYFQSPNRGASAHYFVDSEQAVQGVREKDCAWHAPGCNDSGIGVEHSGYASETRTQWTDDYSSKTLTVSAKLVAGLCKKYSIPVVHLTPAQIKAGQKGIVGHVDVTNAYPQWGDHQDPGKNFPWDAYLGMVRAELAALNGKPWTVSQLKGFAASVGLALSVFAGITTAPAPAPAPVVVVATPTATPKPAPTVKPTPKPSPKPSSSAPKPKAPTKHTPPCPPTAAHPYPGSGAFVLGHSNPNVTLLGQRLIAKGYGHYYKVGPGPVFGQADKNAVAAFQRAHGWTGSAADGYPGPLTWKMLMQ